VQKGFGQSTHLHEFDQRFIDFIVSESLIPIGRGFSEGHPFLILLSMVPAELECEGVVVCSKRPPATSTNGIEFACFRAMIRTFLATSCAGLQVARGNCL